MTPLITIVKPHKIIIIWNKCIFPAIAKGEIGNRVTFYMLDQSSSWGSVQKLEIKLESMNFLCYEQRKKLLIFSSRREMRFWKASL